MMEHHEPMLPVDTLADEGGQEEQAGVTAQEEPMDVPFGWFGISMLLNVLQWAVLLGITAAIIAIIRIFMPVMLTP